MLYPVVTWRSARMAEKTGTNRSARVCILLRLAPPHSVVQTEFQHIDCIHHRCITPLTPLILLIREVNLSIDIKYHGE